MRHQTAGQLANKALKDNTRYQAYEVGEAIVSDDGKQFEKIINTYRDMIGEDEFCAVKLIAEDPLLKNLKRQKFYCWPYLPSPRPNQAVFLYNKKTDKMKRLWVLPNALTMAELASVTYRVHPSWETMQAWSVAFFKGNFWQFIRWQHGIDMLSQEEFIALHRDELIKAGSQLFNPDRAEPFDFSKIGPDKVIDADDSSINEI